MKQQLQQLIVQALTELKSEVPPIVVTPTTDPSHGDYATNVAFSLAKTMGVSPMQAAQALVDQLLRKTSGLVDKVEVAAPGFINFTLSEPALILSLEGLLEQQPSGQFKGQKVMIEFTDPNPFKEFHIGHLYSNIVGESIARLIEATGAEVKRVNYQGDVGLHVAKSLWGIQQQFAKGEWSKEELENKSLAEKAKCLGEAYALGATSYEESETAKQQIIAINKQVYEKDQAIMPLYEQGKQWSLDYFQTIYQRLGTDFWKLYFESEAGPKGRELVKEYQKKGVFKESEGAVIFPGEEYALHTRVFINSLGLPTYEAKEVGLAITKYQDYPFDLSLMITGNEINEYFKVLLKVLSLIRPEIAAKMKHLSHGMVRLPEGKMSSRTGKIVTGEWLLDEAVERAQKKIDEGKEQRAADQTVDSAPTDGKTAELVGVGAVKWALLRSGIGKDVEFSFDESVSFEGNSGPYLQYTYVRTRSILTKADFVEQSSEINPATLELSTDERRLLVLLCQYSDIVVEAAERFAPNMVATYLFELAQLFNTFYQKYPIIKAAEETKLFRLVVTQKTGQVIKDGLNLLGIPTPEHM